MILEPGEKIHVITRRSFEKDHSRHFIGEVIDADANLVRVEGYVFVMDPETYQYTKRPEKRTRIIGLADSGNVINILPVNAELELVTYVQSQEDDLVLMDGKNFSLDFKEFRFIN